MYLKGNFYNSASDKEQTPGDFCLLWFSCLHTWEINNELSQEFKAWLWSLCQKPKTKRDQGGYTGSSGRSAAHTPAWAPALLLPMNLPPIPHGQCPSSALCWGLALEKTKQNKTTTRKKNRSQGSSYSVFWIRAKKYNFPGTVSWVWLFLTIPKSPSGLYNVPWCIPGPLLSDLQRE